MVVALTDLRSSSELQRVDRALLDLGLPDQRRALGNVVEARLSERWTPPKSRDELVRCDMISSDCLDIFARLQARRPALLADLQSVVGIPEDTQHTVKTDAVATSDPLSANATQQPALVEPTDTSTSKRKRSPKKPVKEVLRT